MATGQANGREALRVHAGIIIEHVKPSVLFQFLGTHLHSSFPEIMAAEHTGGQVKAMEIMLNKLLESKEPGLYPLFLEALKQTEYELVSRVVAGYSDVKDQAVYKRMLQIMLPNLMKLKPHDVLPELESKGCLSAIDVQQIRAACSQKGDSWGAMLLLYEVAHKKEDWFPSLMWALLLNGYSHRVKEVENKFIEADSYEGMVQLCDKWRLQKVKSSDCDDSTSDAISTNVTYTEPGFGSDVMATNRSGPDGAEANANRAIRAENVTETNQVAVKYTREELYYFKDRTQNNGIQLPHSLSITIRALGIAKPTESHVDRPTASDYQPRVSPDRPSAIPDPSPDVPQPIVKPKRRQVDLSTMIPHDTSDVNKDPQPLDLRSYQLELAEDAKRGDNCLIVAPTGSGKTHVAMDIAKHHFKAKTSDDVNAKVVFVVPTTALVEQQKCQFETYLTQPVVGISGESVVGSEMALEFLMDTHDIFVLTPQILIDALNRPQGLDTIAQFSLLFFDECHHCMKDHPYNVIMSYYHQEKLDGTAILPQIVGLTASVGVGKARTLAQAESHILKLCANLDAKIATVVENKTTLDQFVNNPQEDNYEVRGRVYDPFSTKVNVMMEEIERMMDGETERHPKKDMEDVRDKMKAPKGRAEQSYTQWIAELDKEIARLVDQSSRRMLHSCLGYLKIYHNALIINSDCRTKDAVEYIAKELTDKKRKQTQNYFDELDTDLLKLYTDQEDWLNVMANEGEVTNPKLDRLKHVILQKYEKKPDSRAILFCKTRELTVALEGWINDDEDMRHLKAKKLVGSNAPASRQGMTQKEQNELILSFKDGTHKIIVATTVAEEGLDISKCNLVLRYEHVTNETARIQAKGRARAEEADYVLVAERGKGAIQKERLNIIREDMMHKALYSITNMDPNAFSRRIRDLQRETRMDRDMKKTAKRMRETLRVRRNAFQLRCRKCENFMCMSTDLRLIQNMHHVCIDSDFYRQVDVHVFDGNFKSFDQIGEFKRAGKLTCHVCGEDWGMQAIYKDIPVPVIAAVSFVAVDTTVTPEKRDTYKQWKDVPFQVEPMMPDNLESVCKSVEKSLSPEHTARLFQRDL